MMFPAQSTEIERIYNHIWRSDIRSLVVTSANSGEGVTTTALALAQRNILAGHATLIVDLNLYHPSLQPLVDINSALPGNELVGMPALVTRENEEMSLVGITAPSDRGAILKLRKPGVLEHCIERWHQDFDTVIIDATPVNRINSNNIPTERIAAACDGCLLVVRSGCTLQSMVAEAVERLQHAGATIAGCVMNDMNNPPLRQELVRECRRLERVLPRLSLWLQNRISGMPILGFDN